MAWTGGRVLKKLEYQCNEFNLTEDGSIRKPEVILRSGDVTVGCTIVSRAAIEKLYSLFQEKYPKCSLDGVRIQ